MGEVWIKESTLTAIGDAVRAKTGVSGLLAPGDMITALDGIKSSGKYLFTKKGLTENVTENTTGGTKVLVTAGESPTSNEIEYTTEEPVYENGTWTFPNSIVERIYSSDTYVPSGNVYVRLTNSVTTLNTWYYVSQFIADPLNDYGTCKKSMQYTQMWQADKDSDIVSYVISDVDDKYYVGFLGRDGYYYELASKIEFTVNGSTYCVAEGMTWKEWYYAHSSSLGINSSGSLGVQPTDPVTISGASPPELYLSGATVGFNDLIVSGGVYTYTFDTSGYE